MANQYDLVTAARAGDGDAFMDLVQLETPDAFRLSLAIHTMADGTAGGCSFDSPGGKDSIGFPHVGKSKYPG